MNDQSHVVGAEMSVYDYNNYDDDGYPTTSRDNASRSAVRWVEGFSKPQMTTDLPAPHGPALKIRLSNRQITWLVNTTACFCQLI